MANTSIDDLLKDDYYISEKDKDVDRNFAKMIDESVKSIEQTKNNGSVTSNSKKRKYTNKGENTRDVLNRSLDVLEETSKIALDKTLSVKMSKDKSIDSEKTIDSVDGFPTTSMLQEGVEFITEKVKNLKTIMRDIIGSDLVKSITQLVKDMNNHVKTGKAVSVTYIKKIFDMLESLALGLTQLTLI